MNIQGQGHFMVSNCSNALVICNHDPPQARGRVGDNRGNERALTKVLPRQSGGNTQGLLYIGKKGCEMKRQQAVGENSSGFTNEQSL